MSMHSLFDLCRVTGRALTPHPFHFLHVHDLDTRRDDMPVYLLFLRFDAGTQAIPALKSTIDPDRRPRWNRTHVSVVIAEINRETKGECIAVGFGSRLGNMKCSGGSIRHLSKGFKEAYESLFAPMEHKPMLNQIVHAFWSFRKYGPPLKGHVVNEAWRHHDSYVEIPITAEGFKRAKKFIAESRANPPPYHVAGFTLWKDKLGGENCWRGAEAVMKAAGIVPKRDAPILNTWFPFPFIVARRIEAAALTGIRTSGKAILVPQRTIATYHLVHKSIWGHVDMPQPPAEQSHPRQRHDASATGALAA